MATTIAKVTHEISTQRGPDVLHKISVPPAWLASGARISLALPRLLNCASCEGGGCDACHRKGALSVREAPDDARLSVRLAASTAGQAQLIRIPEEGAPAADTGWPPGCLILRVDPGACSKGVRLLETSPEPSGRSVGFSKIWLLLPVLTAGVWWFLRYFGG